ncbi:MAG: hypothetical protein QM831_04495 [Kofleriaceae bacterium]
MDPIAIDRGRHEMHRHAVRALHRAAVHDVSIRLGIRHRRARRDRGDQHRQALDRQEVERAAQLRDVGIPERHLHERSRERRMREHVLEQEAQRFLDRLVARALREVLGREAFDRIRVHRTDRAAHDLDVDDVLVVEVAIERADRNSRAIGDLGSADGVVAVLREQLRRGFDQRLVTFP